MCVNLAVGAVFGRRELIYQVKIAFARISERDTPLILKWNGEKIVAVPLSARVANKTLEQPGCLGVYDFESSAEQIFNDLLAVISDRP